MVFIKWILWRVRGFKVSSSDGVWKIEIDSLSQVQDRDRKSFKSQVVPGLLNTSLNVRT